MTKAKLVLVKNQRYTLNNSNELVVTKEISLKCIGFEERKPRNVHASFTDKGELSLSFSFFSGDEFEVLKIIDSPLKLGIEIWEDGKSENSTEAITKEYTTIGEEFVHFFHPFFPNTTYHMKMRIEHENSFTEWSDDTEFTAPEFKACVWKKCPDNVDKEKKYSVDEKNPKIATKTGDNYCTIIGNTTLPPNKIISWGIKILKSENNNGWCIYVGVAPFDINQNKTMNYYNRGWHLDCYKSELFSGPPHYYRWKEYGPRKEKGGEYVRTGDSVGVVMDAIKGELSFVLNEVNYGVAFEGILLDKPLVPCVLLEKKGDSVELDTTEVKETEVDSSIPVPSNIASKSKTWDSIILTWNTVEGASFYQIEIDESKFWDASTTNTFTKRGFLPDTEHNFRIRTVKDNSVSKWSDAVKGRTQKESFEYSWWKECPYSVSKESKYSVDKSNPRIAQNIGDNLFIDEYEYMVEDYHCSCTIIGNTPLPLNKIVSWNIKVLSTEDNGEYDYIGVAPSDINQNNDDNCDSCGWYFYCYSSALYSGPPHKYRHKAYGPRKKDGQYVHAGDTVGVVMDTTNGDLSFALNGVNCGVAYEGIPLDKPLVPCALLNYYGDSVELDTSKVKETKVDSSIPVPSSITAKSDAWDSIILTWNTVEGASFYQIEIDESKFWDASTTNTFTKRGFLPDTEYRFRIRTVKDNSVSEWNKVVKIKTSKILDFSECAWRECPDYVNGNVNYSVDKGNARVATNIKIICTIIGNAPLPLNKVTSWNINILNSKKNDGSGIYIGVAPSDIDQSWFNYYSCGWYFCCYNSSLYAGPPHKYRGKEYGPRKGEGAYVHTGDTVGVVMDTTKGELSFVLNCVNYGVAYERVPLDKPLVPCVILKSNGDSVEIMV